MRDRPGQCFLPDPWSWVKGIAVPHPVTGHSLPPVQSMAAKYLSYYCEM